MAEPDTTATAPAPAQNAAPGDDADQTDEAGVSDEEAASEEPPASEMHRSERSERGFEAFKIGYSGIVGRIIRVRENAPEVRSALRAQKIANQKEQYEKIDAIVTHCTGGTLTSGGINKMLNQHHGVHYYIADYQKGYTSGGRLRGAENSLYNYREGELIQLVEDHFAQPHCTSRKNNVSIGLEVVNQGRWPGYKGSKDYTEKQYRTHVRLTRDLCRKYQNIPLKPGLGPHKVFPTGGPLVKQTATQSARVSEAATMTGLMGHSRTAPSQEELKALGKKVEGTREFDPGAKFDWVRYLEGVRGNFHLPLPIAENGGAGGRPSTEITDATNAPWLAQEMALAGGQFPIGKSLRSWHDGLDFPTRENSRVCCVGEGEIVCARIAAPRVEGDIPLGDTNFVLVKHEPQIGKDEAEKKTFYSLYMHLKAPPRSKLDACDTGVPWLDFVLMAGHESQKGVFDYKIKDGDFQRNLTEMRTKLVAGEIVHGNRVRIYGGETIGFSGKYMGLDILHFEVFSEAKLIDEEGWKLVEEAGDTAFASTEPMKKLGEAVNYAIDRNGSGVITEAELACLYRDEGRLRKIRQVIAKHVIEWAVDLDQIEQTLSQGGANCPVRLTPRNKEVLRLTKEHLQWWRKIEQEMSSANIPLPSTKVLHFYHPIGFLVWLDQKYTAKVEEQYEFDSYWGNSDKKKPWRPGFKSGRRDGTGNPDPLPAQSG